MITFQKAEKEFLEWTRNNPNGFIVSCKSANNMMLHRTYCTHFEFSEPFKHTAHEKVCSSAKHELEQWASKKTKALKYCSSCSP